MPRMRIKFSLMASVALIASALLATLWASGSTPSEADQGAMLGCPPAGRWAIAVWDGPDGTESGQALATCGEGAVLAAYDLDPQTQSWSRWFAGRPGVSTLQTLNKMHGIIALGAVGASPPTATPTPSGRIAFASDRDGNFEIYVMNADGSDPTRLTNNPALDTFPAWSPDSTRIAFQSDRNGNFEIYVMSADGSGLTRLTDNPAADGAPTWSPDSTRIAFTSDRHGNGEVYVMNADGSGQTNLTNDPAFDGIPAWSLDGTRIAFASDRDGNDEVYVMNTDGSAQTRLTDNPANDLMPAWSP